MRSRWTSWVVTSPFVLICMFMVADHTYGQQSPAAIPGLVTGLASLPLLSDAETHMVSPENPTGEKGKGAMAVPNPADPDLPYSKASVDLGQGWKVRPFLKPKPGETVTIMDVDG